MEQRTMSRREFGKVAAAVAAAGAAVSGAPGPASPPNILVILTDDQGWGDLSLHGNTNLKTPNIDALARQGARFDRFYACPVCAPTRAEFLTGRYHPRSGVHGVSTGAERMNVDEKTIGDTFKAAGYATAAFGKWHNGTQYPYHPNARGFDEFYGFCSGHWGQYFDPMLEHNGAIVRGNGFIIDDLTDRALGFMEAKRERPFFCYLPYNTPHTPCQVPDAFWERFAGKDLAMRDREPDKEDLDKTRAILAMCENIDWNVGRLLEMLDRSGLADDTIVVYFSDNGPNGRRWNDGMKGAKGSTDEGGVRVPCFLRWPGHIDPGRTFPQIAGAIDLLPTLADLAGVPLISTKPLDGISLKPLLTGAAEDTPDRMIFSRQRNKISVRTQTHRLDAGGRLYDMTEDPGQYRDISKREPELTDRLKQAVGRWQREAIPENEDRDDRPFPVGHPAFPSAWLPARDGVGSGNVQRSAKAPNCSFFTNWKDTGDRIRWDVEVATDGDYEALVYYTCPAADVGSMVELEFMGSRIRGRVREAHDPPLVGAEFDRVPRGTESYVKDFRPLRLGTVRLKSGRGDLSLKAVEIPGGSVMDVRAVMLTLQP